MDGILNSKIKRWVVEFSKSTLDWDSYHINELQNFNIQKKDWVQCAFNIYSLCKKIINNNHIQISASLCFELNITKSHRLVPPRLSKQCFNKTNTFPEVYLFKNDARHYLLKSGAVYLQNLSYYYDMRVFLLEDKEDVFWRWLFFIDKND